MCFATPVFFFFLGSGRASGVFHYTHSIYYHRVQSPTPAYMPSIRCPKCDEILVSYSSGRKNDLDMIDSLGLVRIINRKNYLESEMAKIDKALDELINKVRGRKNDEI